MQNPNQKELAKLVHCTAQLTIQWDGKEIDLSKGAVLKYGIVEHWQGLHPNVQFTIEEVKETPKAAREIENPLETMDRGESFASLKKRRQLKEGE